MDPLNGYPFELENFDPEADTITSEVMRPELGAADRSIARRASLQILYELDTTDHEMRSVLEVHLAERPEAYAVRRIIRRIVSGVIANRGAIDAILQQYAPEFPVDQVAVVDRNILRMAIYEHLLQTRETPIAVIINEAVQLARLFGADQSHSFVHGVLGALTSEADFSTVSPEDLLEIIEHDERGGIQLTSGARVKWESRMQRYRASKTGRFVARSVVGYARHRVLLFFQGSRQISSRNGRKSDDL